MLVFNEYLPYVYKYASTSIKHQKGILIMDEFCVENDNELGCIFFGEIFRNKSY